MKIANASFDRFIEQHYLDVYQAAADWVSDPLDAARVTARVFRHARQLTSEGQTLAAAKEVLGKIVVLESLANAVRTAPAKRQRLEVSGIKSSKRDRRAAWSRSVVGRRG